MGSSLEVARRVRENHGSSLGTSSQGDDQANYVECLLTRAIVLRLRFPVALEQVFLVFVRTFLLYLLEDLVHPSLIRFSPIVFDSRLFNPESLHGIHVQPNDLQYVLSPKV